MANHQKVGELDEIILKIFFSFDALEVLKASLVSKRWHRIANDNSLWRNLVLRRWPSQTSVLRHVSTLGLKWQRVYRYLLSIGFYSPDDMKYFIVCKVSDPILECEELCKAFFYEMHEVNSAWAKPALHELEETSPRFFNNNMELYYDTHDLKWVFVDRRREYVDDSFTIRLNLDRMSSRQMRFIRPYQVMASCVMMYRWLILFQHMFTEDVGLAFYRIWRFRLKHLETGLIFETYDWKAAMSSTFSHGCPFAKRFRDDGLAILDMLSSPFFITHPLGMAYKICYELCFLPYSESAFSSENVSRSSSLEILDSSKSEVKPCENGGSGRVEPSPSSDTLSSLGSKSANDDDDSEDNGDDYGYFCNCEYFIHRSSWEYEEQQLVQAEAATKWETTTIHSCPTFELIFDSYEEKWLFCWYNVSNTKHPRKLNRLLVEESLESAKTIRESSNDSELGSSVDPGPSSSTDIVSLSLASTCTEAELLNLNLGQEAMPSSLILYRLICLFDLTSPQYKSSQDYCVWSVGLLHRSTRGILQFKDLNGWLRLFVYFNDELKLYCSDLAVMSLNRNIEFLDEASGQGANMKSVQDGLSSISSDNHSEVSSDGSEDDLGNPLEKFKKDVRALLQLLVNQKFAHPYGTVAGAVA